MAAALAHRGPDGERMVGHERARLGARRLAIMDLTTGDQPFESPDHAIWMICNGEIYNAPARRQEGTLAGYPFRASGDIETIVPLYQRLGPDAVARLEGMFGLAVWDDARGRLVLARDRAGEKPLFWTEVAGELRFASEVQALLVYPDQPRRVNPEAVALYAALGYVPAPRSSGRSRSSRARWPSRWAIPRSCPRSSWPRRRASTSRWCSRAKARTSCSAATRPILATKPPGCTAASRDERRSPGS